jgi:hypothetical protein
VEAEDHIRGGVLQHNQSASAHELSPRPLLFEAFWSSLQEQPFLALADEGTPKAKLRGVASSKEPAEGGREVRLGGLGVLTDLSLEAGERIETVSP